MPHRFVTASGHHSARELDAYLYSHTTVLDGALGTVRVNRAVLVTTADTDRQADYRAQYQSDRLASGLIGSRVFGAETEAREWLAR
jgi:hypothetical protein